MVAHPCEADIAKALLDAPVEFLDAHASQDETAQARFEHSWAQLSDVIQLALERDALSVSTVRLALSVSQSIQTLSAQVASMETQTSALREEMRAQALVLLQEQSPADESLETSEARHSGLPFSWVQPLLEYTLENISSPYPAAEDKQRLLDEVIAAGWSSATQKKLDDWMGLTRSRMGYTAILKSSAIEEDRALLEDYIRRVLSGVPSDRDGLPDGTICAIEEMHQWVLEQYDARSAKEQASLWAQDVLGLVQRVTAAPDEESFSDVEEPVVDDFDDSDDTTVNSEDDSDFSDYDSSNSETDVDDWADQPIRGIIGAKRKYSGLQGLGFPTSSSLSRSSSSSSLSSRGHSIWSRRSSSGSTSASSVDLEQEQREETDRPTKRRRSSVELPSYDPSSPATSSLENKPSQPSPVDASSSDSLLLETTSPCSSSSPPSAQSPEPIPFPSSALFPAESPAVMAAGSMQKRKRAASDDEDARPVVSKRRRHSASPPSIPMQHFGALGIIGHLPWDGFSCASSAVELELEAYALDSSPFAHGVAPEPLDDADEEVEKEDDEEEDDVYDGLIDYCNERMLEDVVEDGTPGTFTWSEMQLHVLDSILSYGARPTPAATATRNVPLSSPQGFRLDLPSLDDDDLAYLLNIAAGPPIPPPAEMISPPLPSMDGQTFDLDLDVKPPLPESNVDNFVRMLQGWTSASAACPIRLDEPAPFADAEVDEWAFDFLTAASADLMTH